MKEKKKGIERREKGKERKNNLKERGERESVCVCV